VVGSPPGVELGAFTRWAATALPAATPPFTAQMLVGGQSNITVRLDDDDDGGGGGHAYVLRRPPLHSVLATAHDVLREHRIMAALHMTPVPVPPTLASCDDPRVLGAPFFVMRHVDGLVLEHVADVEAGLPVGVRRPAAESLVDTLVALHAVDPDAVGLGDLAKRDDLVRRQLRRWHAQFGAITAAGGSDALSRSDEAAIDHVHAVLDARVPEQRDATIVHGDFRLGNCIVDAATGQVAAVLDWELCTLGDPLVDVGYLLATWSDADDRVRSQVDNPSTAAGFPRRAELRDRYAAGSGRDLTAIDFYVTFSYWRLACILAGVLARLESGARGEAGDDTVAEFRTRMAACVTLAEEHAGAL
jgi:aminoglycoside phosphotransferase (APT) family kinase protein